MSTPSPALEAAPARWIYVGKDLGQGLVHDVGPYRIGVYSAAAPGRETPNEDAAAVFGFGGGSVLLVVADGMGGMPQGGRASALLVDAIEERLKSRTPDAEGGLRADLLEAIDRANERIQALGVGAGSTLAAVEINDDSIRSCHVGDSMIMVVGQRGRMKLQTVSHSPVGYAVEAGMLSADDALHHDERNVVSNMVGFPNMRIEIGPTVQLAHHDTVLLASDGLFDNLYIEEIVEAIRRGSIEASMSRLIDQCQGRMTGRATGQPCKPDDLTFILLRRHRSGQRRPRGL